MRHRLIALLMLVTLPAFGQAATEPHLDFLKPFTGKTWRGQFPGTTPALYDTARWEWALNGRAIRVRHELSNGTYGGESIIVWDAEQEKASYYYFTTAGFNTHGTFEVSPDGRIMGIEKVSGNANGITEVRSWQTLLPDGQMHVRTEYLQNGAWVPGREMEYVEDPSATVLLK